MKPNDCPAIGRDVCNAGTVWAIQPNGERIGIENWAYEAWRVGRMNDPTLSGFLERAVQINLSPGWPS